MVDANILELRDDGTVGPTMPEGAPPIYRHCATDNHGSVAGLLAEMRSRRKSGPLPWESKEARDAAAHWVGWMLWLHARTRSALLRHIGRTPYLEISNMIQPVHYTSGGPNFAHHLAARTIPLLSYFQDDLRAEAARCANGQATRAEPIPYASREVRNEQAKYIKEAEDLTEKDRAMLLAHVARTPYLQVEICGDRDRSNDHRLDPVDRLVSLLR